METSGVLWADYVPVAERVSGEYERSVVSKEGNSDIDKNAFLMLMITQMKYQDPMNPIEDKEFVAQLAQFSALEQMTNLNQTAMNSQTYSLIGKEVQAEVRNEQTGEVSVLAGFVEGVRMINKKPFLVIDGNADVLAEDVVSVKGQGQGQEGQEE